MQPLELNKVLLTLIGVCKTLDYTHFRTIQFKLIGITLFLLQAHDVYTSASYIFLFKSVDLAGSLSVILQLAACISSMYTLANALRFSTQFLSIFAKLQEIYQQSAQSRTYKYFIEADAFGRKITIFFVRKFLLGYLFSSAVMGAVNLLVCYVTYGYVDTKYLFTPFKRNVPWNENTLTGWVLSTIYNMIGAGTYFFTNYVFLTYYVAICAQFYAFSKHFECLISKVCQNGNISLITTIRFHIFVKVFFHDTAQIFNTYTFIQVLCGTIYMAACLFQLDMALSHLNIYICLSVTVVTVSTLNLFLHCYYGHYVTENCLKFCNSSYESEWYNLSIKMQRHFVLMIANAQRPLFYSGFGIVLLNMETFSNLIRTVITYYLMFKTITINND